MRDAGHRTPDIGQRTSDGEKSKNNISTPQGGGHNNFADGLTSELLTILINSGDTSSDPYDLLWNNIFFLKSQGQFMQNQSYKSWNCVCTDDLMIWFLFFGSVA